MEQAEFRDPRLVEVYDVECPWSRDDDWFAAVVAARGGSVRVVDVGCGTGRLAIALAAAGHRVTGVEPAPASLAAARAKPGASGVTWIEGTTRAVRPGAFDVALMTGHVAQLFLTDGEWADVLHDLRLALVPGGVVAFDARDPAKRAWDRWNGVDTYRHVGLPGGRTVRIWTQLTDACDGIVSFTHHYRFDGGDERRSEMSLRFRDEHELRDSLPAAGFEIVQVAGGWGGEPVGHADGELLVVARRR